MLSLIKKKGKALGFVFVQISQSETGIKLLVRVNVKDLLYLSGSYSFLLCYDIRTFFAKYSIFLIAIVISASNITYHVSQCSYRERTNLQKSRHLFQLSCRFEMSTMLTTEQCQISMFMCHVNRYLIKTYADKQEIFNRDKKSLLRQMSNTSQFQHPPYRTWLIKKSENFPCSLSGSGNKTMRNLGRGIVANVRKHCSK